MNALALSMALSLAVSAAPPAPVFREYAVGAPDSGPAIVTVGEDGAVWVALARAGRVARLSNGVVDTFELGADSRPVGIAVGSAANGHAGVVWITASYDNKLIKLDIASRTSKAYALGANSWPFNVAIGADGAVWFTERAAARLGRFDPVSDRIEHFDLPTPASGPAGLGLDARSGRVWLTESYADRIAMFDPATRQFREFVMGTTSTGLVSGPAGLAVDGQGGVWFAKLEGRLGYLAPGAEQVETIVLPPDVRRPAGVAIAPDGAVWAAALDGNLLARYDPRTRDIVTFRIPTGAPDAAPSTPPQARTSRPFGIAHDRDGNVWFSQQYTGQLAVLDVATPQVTIVSPAGVVRTAEPLLTLLVRERVGAVASTTVRLNGSPMPVVNGRLSLDGVREGKQQLEVEVLDTSGQRGVARAEFAYAPATGATREIQLLSDPPYVSIERLQVTLGDTVVWSYPHQANAHAPAAPLRRLDIAGGPQLVQSPLLRAGDSFRHRFETAGTFSVSDPTLPSARTTIVVVAKDANAAPR